MACLGSLTKESLFFASEEEEVTLLEYFFFIFVFEIFAGGSSALFFASSLAFFSSSSTWNKIDLPSKYRTAYFLQILCKSSRAYPTAIPHKLAAIGPKKMIKRTILLAK